MADMYVDDNGSNTSPYDTWAKAATTIATALAAQAAGERIYISSDHVEQYNADTTLSSTNGTILAPVYIISADKASGEPPVTYDNMVSGGGSLDAKTNGPYDIILDGNDVWMGIDFIVGDNLSMHTSRPGVPTSIKIIDSRFSVDDSTLLGNSDGEVSIIWENVDLVQVTAGEISVYGGRFIWRLGSFTFNGGSITSLFIKSAGQESISRVTVQEVDLSAITDAADYLVQSGAITVDDYLFKRCKLSNTFGGALASAILTKGFRVILDSCSSVNGIYLFEHYHLEGQIEDETSIYLDATYNGTNNYSVKMTTNTYVEEFFLPLRFKLCEVYVSSTGKVLTVELITTDAVAAVDLYDDDFWIEVEYPDSTVAAFGRILSTRMADPLDTPAALDASTKGAGDWTGELADTNYYKVDADFTTVANEAAGVYTIWACLARPSTTVYIDPKVTIT